jgi:hypothetical protein
VNSIIAGRLVATRILSPLAISASVGATLCLACGGETPVGVDAGADAGGGGERVVAVAGDFSAAGVFSTLDLPSLTVTIDAIAGVAGPDPIVRRLGEELFIVNRAGGDNVTIIDAITHDLIAQHAVGAGANPQDVAVFADTLFVPALAEPGVVAIDRSNGNSSVIDLSSLDVDGHPNCVSAYVVDGRVFVACGVLDETYTPRGNGKLAVIDATTHVHLTTLDLPVANPLGLLQPAAATGLAARQLLLGTVPDYQDFSSGCLLSITATASPTATCLLSNQLMGGYANHVESSADGEQLWLAVNGFSADDFSPFGNLRSYDVTTATLSPTPISGGTQIIVDFAVCPSGVVVAADRSQGESGLRVYEAGAEVTASPLSIGMPPGYGNNLACIAR